jgi:hypothetical protein
VKSTIIIGDICKFILILSKVTQCLNGLERAYFELISEESLLAEANVFLGLSINHNMLNDLQSLAKPFVVNIN